MDSNWSQNSFPVKMHQQILFLLFSGLMLLSACKSTMSPAPETGRVQESLAFELNDRGDALYQHGAGNPDHYGEALSSYRIAAEAGLANAQFFYARMHQYGHGCAQDFEVAWEFYQKAAKSGDRRAWNNLGYMLKTGQGREPNPSESLPYYMRSSEMGMPMGSYNVGIHYHFNPTDINFEEAIKYYRQAIEQYPRYAGAYNQIGRIYEDGGHGVEPDLTKAFNAFLLASTYGDPYGPMNLGRFYREGWVVETDLVAAEKLFVESAQRGNASAWNLAGSLYWLTEYEQQDLRQALEHYLKASAAGEKEFLHRIGYIYKSGPEALQDADKAFAALQESAERGQPRGVRSLGYCYAYGVGTPLHRAKAEALWLDCGGDESLIQWHQLGLLMAREDTDMPPDLQKAEAYLAKGTATDYPGRAESWRRLGYLYRDAPEPMRDRERALDCFRKAVELGDEQAQAALSHLEHLN
jgi:uncharacterized protein